MTEKQTPEPVRPRMSCHLSNFPSMCDPDAVELVMEDGKISIRSLSSKNKLSRLQTGYQELRLPEFYHDSYDAADKACYNKQLLDLNIVAANKFNVPQLEEEIIPQQTMHNDMQVPQSCFKQSEARAPLPTGVDNLQGKPRTCPTRSNPFEKKGKFMEPQKEWDPSSSRVHGPSSSSVCSRGASNCPIYTLQTRYEDTDLSDNNATEEAHETIKAKRKRKPEVHSLSEKRRREKINKKMRALQELIPNCNEVDKASVLDKAIDYLKTLQLQVQMTSMGSSGVYMPRMMLLPAPWMQLINARVPSGGYSPMSPTMQMALGCTSVMPGINQARLNMFGLPGQVLLSSMPPWCSPPFASLAARFPRLPVQTPANAAAASLSASMDSNRAHQLK